MRNVILAVVTAGILFGFSQSPLPPSTEKPVPEIMVVDLPPPVEFDGKGLPKIFLPNVWGTVTGAQICPISPTVALTARHVAIRGIFTWGYPSSRLGGTVVMSWLDKRRDVGALIIAQGPAFDRWFKLATQTPSVGDKVFIQGFDTDDDFRTVWIAVQVVYIYAGQLAYDGTSGPGSSGSCVLNRAGEVVAINTASYMKGSKAHGSGNLLTGPWSPFATGAEMWKTKNPKDLPE